MFDPDDLTQVLGAGSVQESCKKLMSEVAAKQSTDNATAVLVQFAFEAVGLTESLNIVGL